MPILMIFSLKKEWEAKQGEYHKIGPVNGNHADGYYLESEEKNDNWLIWREN